MKKLLIVLTCLLLLAGCSKNSSDAKITKNDVYWTYGDVSFTSSELYELAKSQDYSGFVISEILNVIAEKEELDLEPIKEELSEEYDSYASISYYKEYLDAYYADKDAYIEDQIVNSIASELMKKVADQNFDQYVEEYVPYKAEVAYFDSTEQAQAVIDAVNNETNTFAYAASENGYTSSIYEEVYTDDADLPIEVKEQIGITESGVTDIVTTSITATDNDGNSVITPRYYVVNVIDKDANNFKDDFISYIVNNVLVAEEVLNDYMDKYDVEIHDQYVYDKLVETYSAISIK